MAITRRAITVLRMAVSCSRAKSVSVSPLVPSRASLSLRASLGVEGGNPLRLRLTYREVGQWNFKDNSHSWELTPHAKQSTTKSRFTSPYHVVRFWSLPVVGCVQAKAVIAHKPVEHFWRVNLHRQGAFGIARSAYLINNAQVTPMSQRAFDRATVIDVASSTLARGATLRAPHVANWNAAGDCSKPVYREMLGRDRAHIYSKIGKFRTRPDTRLELHVRCRKCANCLRKRAAHWRLRAMAELRASERTWFGTLTYRPDIQYQAKLAAADKLGKDWSEASAADFFRLHDSALNQHVQRYFKRLRKNTGASVRYILVTEAHKSGDPHHHLLLHCSADLTWRNVTDPWVDAQIGYCKFVLADERSAIYVCKYLTKSILSRLRSSFHYGNPLNGNEKGGTGPIKAKNIF